MVLDGQTQGYISSSSSMEDQLGLPDDLVERILQLQDTFNSVDADIDVFADPTLVDGACKLLLRISTIVICQEPHKYGQTDKLCLVRMYLHLCIGKDGTLKPVSACMSIIAALEFCMQAVANFRFLDPATGLFHKDRVEVTADKVSSIMKLYFYHNSNSASAHLQSLLSYGQVLAKDNSTSFHFLWNADLTGVKFGTKIILVERLPALVHDAQQQAMTLLRQLLLLPDSSPLMINLHKVRDHLHNTQPGYNFAVATTEEAQVEKVLCRAVAGSRCGTLLLMDHLCKEMEFDPDGTHSYLSKHDEFVKLLAVLIELSSGLPARGTELLSLQHTNMLLGPRNLFVHDSMVFTALPTNKGTGCQKVVPRFLPHVVGCWVVHYVTHVVPFVHLLHNATVKPITCLSQPDFALCNLCHPHIEEPVTPLRTGIAVSSPLQTDNHTNQCDSRAQRAAPAAQSRTTSGSSSSSSSDNHGSVVSWEHTFNLYEAQVRIQMRWTGFIWARCRKHRPTKAYLIRKRMKDTSPKTSSGNMSHSTLRQTKRAWRHPFEIAPWAHTNMVQHHLTGRRGHRCHP